MNSSINSKRNGSGGFSVIELILVITILALLTAMATPAFSMFQKSSRLQQTTRTVLSVLNKARAEAQRCRTLVAAHFGDDVTQLNPQPKAGVLPPYGEINIYEINQCYNDGCDWLTFSPFAPEYGYYSCPVWYPCLSKKRILTPEPMKFSSGVRIITCQFRRTNGMNIIAFPYYQKSAVGEIKRHCCSYDKRGAAAGYDSRNNFYYALILDVATGEHVLIQIGVFESNGRPRVLPWQVTHIMLPGANAPKAVKPQDLNAQINNYPTADNWSF